MKDYVEREAVIKGFTDLLQKPGDIYPTDITTMMQRIPAADVRPVVRGKNIGKDYNEVDQFVCSECGIELQGWVRVEHDEDTWETTHYEYRLNFCPNCGADMRGEQDE